MEPRVWAARLVAPLAPVLAVIAVHASNLRYPLFYDDYSWLAVPDHHGWLARVMTPVRGAAIYRPGLALWFAGMRAVFGTSAFPYHLVALAFLVAAALALRWLGLELGLGSLGATAGGVLYGAFAALTLATMWVSAAGSSLAVALAVASVALVCRPSPRRQIAAAVLLAAAILVRDATVVTPAAAALVLAARSIDGKRIISSLRRTWVLWLVAIIFLAIRGSLAGMGSNSGPYAVSLGGNLAKNVLAMMRLVSRLGLENHMPDRIPDGIIRVWDVVFWVSIFGASAWATRRRNYVPLAGVGWFFVSLSPVIILPNHPMAPYYLDVPAAGLALSAASLASMIRLTRAAIVTALAVGVFVLVNAGAVLRFQRYDYFPTTIVKRTEVLQRIAMTQQPRNGQLVVVTNCTNDQEWSGDGDLFRVLQNAPDLRVRFEVVKPETCTGAGG